jgi:hypothetical protein
VIAQGHERVLQRRSRARVRVDVSRGDRVDPQPCRERGERLVARAVVALERALELDAQALGREGGAQAAQRRLVVRAMRRAAAEADQSGRVLLDRRERHLRRRVGGRAGIPVVRVRGGEDAAEVAPALRVAHQQREVAAVAEVDLRPVDRLQPHPRRGLRELHRARHAVVVGERHGLVAELRRRARELVRQRRAVQEREGRVGVQLDVGHRCANHPPPSRSRKTTRLRPSAVTSSQ